jgi:hypothetical protein
MTRDQFAEHLGVPLSSVKQWTLPGGILHGNREPGVFTSSDAAVCRVLLELQRIMGEKSAQAYEYAKQLAPRVRANMGTGTKAIKVRIPGDVLTVELQIGALREAVAAT